MLQQVEAIMGPAGLDNPDEAAPSDLLMAAVHHLRTRTPLALVRVHDASPFMSMRPPCSRRIRQPGTFMHHSTCWLEQGQRRCKDRWSSSPKPSLGFLHG